MLGALCKTVLSISAIGAGLTGCSFSGLVADHSVDYNRAIRKVSNSNVLLNSLRARDRLPMQFAAISKISGDFTFSPSGALTVGSIPFENATEPDLDVTGTLVGSVSYVSNPSYDVVPLDSQEFLNGILTPLDPSILEFYISQGWPKELLFHLFFEDIQIGDKKIKNDPCDADQFADFQTRIDENVDRINIVRKNLISEKTPLFNFNPDKDIKYVADINSAELEFEEIKSDGGSQYRLIKKSARYFICPFADGSKCKSKRAKISALKDGAVERDGSVESSEPGDTSRLTILEYDSPALATQRLEKSTDERAETDATPTDHPQEADKPQEYVKEAHLRSVQGIIYYLGEVLRTQGQETRPDCPATLLPERKPIKVKTGSWESTLFNLVDAESEKSLDDFIFEHDGRRFGIPKDSVNAGRSAQVVELISQLIGLQKKREELPTTQSIRLIGQ